MKIGVYGGTFNPPHLGHAASARYAATALGLDKLLFVPAALPPHKALPEGTPAPAHRSAMVEIMADCLGLGEGAQVSDAEIARPGKSYTADTLERLRAQYPGDELWLLVGGDMFASLPDWHAPERIMALAGVAAFARREDGRALLHTQAARLERDFGARVRVVELPQITDISSTRLRALLPAGEGREFLEPSVYGYILRHGLYGVPCGLKALDDAQLRACSYSMMRAKRIPHVRGTEEEAVRLARRWGADEGNARRAAILHDCTKYYTMDEQLQLCAKYGILLDDLEQKAVKLLHAKTGAWIARDVYGANDAIFDAIYWHTTAKADMALLEKILYIADYMEPTRDFPGVERLREAAYRDLDEAVLMGCEMSVQEMADRNLPVHHNTVEARDWLKGQR